MSVMRFLLLDDTEHHVIGRVLEDAREDGDRVQADAWRVQSTIRRDEFVVHGLTDAGHLMALPSSMKLRTWMVGRLRALADTGDQAGRVMGWAPRFFVEQIAERIENENASAGEPGSVRVGQEDLRALLDATDAWASTLSPAIRKDEREEQEALRDVVDRVGTLAAMVWTEPRG
jgi:hypothetical protein